ncbi:MAG: DUF3817 domain-containing protein [Verrucomicrobiae bacterium]|nr:DUF3817 domain-containing protein [Verrucomicrobiae bacterium]
MSTPANSVSFLRKSGIAEGISFLLLVGIAMPLKYLADKPMAVSIVGWIHGVLFVIFCVALVKTYAYAKWPATRCIFVFIAALLPFGPFAIDGKMKRWQSEADSQSLQ